MPFTAQTCLPFSTWMQLAKCWWKHTFQEFFSCFAKFSAKWKRPVSLITIDMDKQVMEELLFAGQEITKSTILGKCYKVVCNGSCGETPATEIPCTTTPTSTTTKTTTKTTTITTISTTTPCVVSSYQYDLYTDVWNT